jgi:hypothetical protein
MEELPRRVAKIEKGRAVGVDEEAVVVRDAQGAVGKVYAGAFEGFGLG